MSAAHRVAVAPVAAAIPWVTSGEFLTQHHPSFGDPVDVLIAFNAGDILISTDLHPAAFPTSAGRIVLPNMLLVNDRGEAIAVKSVSTGYGNGGGPGAAKDLLGQLSWPAEQIDLITSHDFLWLRRDGIVRSSINPISNISERGLEVDADGAVTVQVEAPAGRSNVLVRNNFDSATGWIEDVLRADPPPPWAHGEPVARCYFSYDAVVSAGLTQSHTPGTGLVSVIIEQGQTQLWCLMPLPDEGERRLPDATCDLLDVLGLPADSLRASAPRSWWKELLGWLRDQLAGNGTSTPYVDVSGDGERGLLRPPGR